MSMELIEYPDREMLALSLASRLAGQLSQHLRVSDGASLCVPGGTTPAPVYEMLSGSELDWPRVTVFLNDERWVDGDHPRSNSRLLHRHLLRDKAQAARYIDLYTGDATPEQAVPALTETLVPHLPITVLVLGMGDDMHTASLFPNAPGLEALLASDAPPVMAAAGGAEPRITLTAPALQSALNIHIMIKGAQKRAALEAAIGADPVSAPISAFLRNAVVHYAE